MRGGLFSAVGALEDGDKGASGVYKGAPVEIIDGDGAFAGDFVGDGDGDCCFGTCEDFAGEGSDVYIVAKVHVFACEGDCGAWRGGEGCDGFDCGEGPLDVVVL